RPAIPEGRIAGPIPGGNNANAQWTASISTRAERRSGTESPWRPRMPRFAANLTMLFNEVPFLDRFERAARAGFTAVEFLFPYAYPVREIKARLDAHRLSLVLHNLPAGDWDAGERGIAVLPDRVNEFR